MLTSVSLYLLWSFVDPVSSLGQGVGEGGLVVDDHGGAEAGLAQGAEGPGRRR